VKVFKKHRFSKTKFSNPSFLFKQCSSSAFTHCCWLVSKTFTIYEMYRLYELLYHGDIQSDVESLCHIHNIISYILYWLLFYI